MSRLAAVVEWCEGTPLAEGDIQWAKLFTPLFHNGSREEERWDWDVGDGSGLPYQYTIQMGRSEEHTSDSSHSGESRMPSSA